MPEIPLEFFSLEVQVGGNNIGSFTEADERFLRTYSHFISHALVEVDLKKGVVKYIEIEVQGRQPSQFVDYVGIPFWCTRCHIYDYLASDCVMLLHKKFMEKERYFISRCCGEFVNIKLINKGIKGGQRQNRGQCCRCCSCTFFQI